jgi:hemolysin activation/secretion protein
LRAFARPSWRALASAAAALLLGTALGASFAQAQQAAAQAAVVPAAPSVVGRDVIGVEPGTPRHRAEITFTNSLVPKIDPALLTRDVEFRHIAIDGATAFTAQQILPLFAPLLNRRVKFSEVVAAVDQVTAMYEKEGYIFYSVNLPQQDLGGDTLRVSIVEGTVANIEIADGIAAEKARQRIHDLLAPLIGKRPLRKAELERRLLLAADTPGSALTANAKPSDGDPTKVDLVIGGTFERFTPIAQIDSFQTTPDTSVNFRVGAIGRSLAFGGDQLELRYLSALPWNSLHLFDARYGVPIGNDGGRLNFLGQAVLQRPPVTLNGQSIDYLARSLLGRVGYSYPVVRGPKWTLLGFTMVDVIDVDYYFLGFNVPGDSLRVWRSGAGTTVTDEIGGIWTASALASVGLGVADASANGRFSATPTFFKANFSVERVQPIGNAFAVMVRGAGQAASGTVPASEVYAYGGRDYGRAFVVAQTYGDRGVAVAGELRYTPDWIPISRELIEPQLYLFADHAWLGSDDPRNAPFFYEGSSVGGGLRARVKQKYTGEIEFAQGFGTPPLVNFNPWRINFRIGTAF